MSNSSEIQIIINDLKMKTESLLMAPESVNEKDLEYWTVNFQGWILNPFIEHIQESIASLNYTDYLLKKLQNWMEEINLFIDEDLKKVASPRNYPHQKSYLIALTSALTSIAKEISKFLEQEQDQEDYDPGNTSLTRDETALLILYLQEQKVIFPNNLISDSRLSEAFETLTGYRKEQIRKVISGERRLFKNEISTKERNYRKLQSILSEIIGQIDKDLESFN